MAVPVQTEILIGGFAYFIPAGTVVDGTTVAGSSAGKPDTDPATNWTAYSIGDVLNFKFGDERVDIASLVPLASGGYAKKNKSIVVQDFVTLKTRQMGEIIHRLQFGLAAAIATGTAQTPHLELDRKIFGWLRLQGRQLGGTDRFILDWWAECRIEETGEFNDKVVEPVLRFTQVKGTEGNSINFPA
jgi:hypothetical protein